MSTTTKARRRAKVEVPEAATQREMVTVKLLELRPNPANPNKHPESQIERLMASLRRDGQTRPLLARKANMMLIAGHGIHTAARRLGWTDIEVILWDCDEATAKRVMLADERLSKLSELDPARVASLMKEIGEVDWLSTGYSVEEAAKLFEGFNDSEMEVYEIETSNVTDDFWVTVRGPLAEQANVLQRMKVLMKEYPHITIDVSTVEDQ